MHGCKPGVAPNLPQTLQLPASQEASQQGKPTTIKPFAHFFTCAGGRGPAWRQPRVQGAAVAQQGGAAAPP